MCFQGLIPEGDLLFFKTHVNILYVSGKIYSSHILGLKISLMLPPGSNIFKRDALHEKDPFGLKSLFCQWVKRNKLSVNPL